MAGGGDGTPQSKNWKFKNSTCGGQKPLEFLIFGRWDMWVCRMCGWDTWVTKRMGQDVSLPDLADVTSGFRDLGQPWAPELYDSAVWWQSYHPRLCSSAGLCARHSSSRESPLQGRRGGHPGEGSAPGATPLPLTPVLLQPAQAPPRDVSEQEVLVNDQPTGTGAGLGLAHQRRPLGECLLPCQSRCSRMAAAEAGLRRRAR